MLDLSLPETIKGLRVEKTDAGIQGWLDHPNQPSTLIITVGYETLDTDPFVLNYIWVRPEYQQQDWLIHFAYTLVSAASDVGYKKCEFRGLLTTKPLTVHGAVEIDPRTVAFDISPTDPFYSWGTTATTDPKV